MRNVSQEQLNMPAGFSTDGKRMLTLQEVVATNTPSLRFFQLAPKQQAQLTIERIKRQNQFKLGMIGAGVIDKERAVKEVESLSETGKVLIEIEQRTISRLIGKFRSYLSYIDDGLACAAEAETTPESE